MKVGSTKIDKRAERAGGRGGTKKIFNKNT